MSKRSIRKVRHIKPALTFKLKVRQGQLKGNMESALLSLEEAEAFESGFTGLPAEIMEEINNSFPVEDGQEPVEHVHGESCNHDH